MAATALSLSDPEVAAATFAQHMDQLWATGRPRELRWGRIDLSPMETVVAMPGVRPDGGADWYFIKLGARYYDAGPPTATFVTPVDWSDAVEPSRWFPVIDNRPPWFGLHSSYKFLDGSNQQLICCSMVAQYYLTSHTPTDEERWTQGKDTVAATLNRIAEMLGPKHYRKPSA